MLRWVAGLKAHLPPTCSARVLSDGMYEPWHGTDYILSQRLHALPSLNEGVLGNERVLLRVCSGHY